MSIDSELKKIIGIQNFYKLKAKMLRQEQAFLTYTRSVQDNLQYTQNISKSNEYFAEQNNLFHEYMCLSLEVLQYLQKIVVNSMMKSSIAQYKDILKNTAFVALLQKELDKYDYSVDFFPSLVKKNSLKGIACDVTDEFIENANTTDLLLTIFIVTYNHEETIARCIESVINQVTQYRHKIYILEDCSTDNTLATCKKYAEKHADLIELIAQPVNTYYKGKLDPIYGVGSERHTSIARKNLLNTPYWYQIEGDDYLLDKHVVQRAINFLEKHTDYVGFCSSFLHYSTQDGKVIIEPPLNTAFSEFTANYYKYSHTSTRFYRNIIDWNTYIDIENYFDTVLWHEYLMRGKFFFYNIVASVYRKNKGEWGSISKDIQEKKYAMSMEYRKKRSNKYGALTDDPNLHLEYKEKFAKKNYLKTVEKLLLENNIPNFSQVATYRYFKEKESDIKNILSYLVDRESKEQYLTELNRLIISSLVGYEEGVKFFCNMSYVEHEKYKENAKSKNYPKFKMSIQGEIVETVPVGTFVIEEYRYKDIFVVEKGEVVIDGGGFCGETAAWFLENGAQKVHLFEPMMAHHTLIEQNISMEIKEGKVIVNHKGLSDKQETVSFNENGAGSRIAENGSVTINCISIDEYCQEHQVIPTFIKMDIEGAELKALIGAKDIIKKHKPKLAICLYHKFEDMIELPLYIKELVPAYEFYCKANHPYWEFVLYAVAKKNNESK